MLKPLPVRGPFQSAALNLVIHCLPGPSTRKALAVTDVAAVLAPDGILFGASVLGGAGPHTWLSRRVLHAFNRRGAFDNLEDSEAMLRRPARGGLRAGRDGDRRIDRDLRGYDAEAPSAGVTSAGSKVVRDTCPMDRASRSKIGRQALRS